MSIEVRVPQLPESVADATLVAWHKKPGEAVSRDENLVDLETDKVVLEVPAPSRGVIKEIKVENGATVTSGQVLAILEEKRGAARPKPAAAAAAATQRGAPAALPRPSGRASSRPARQAHGRRAQARRAAQSPAAAATAASARATYSSTWPARSPTPARDGEARLRRVTASARGRAQPSSACR